MHWFTGVVLFTMIWWTVLFAVLPDDLKVVGLAAGHATSFLAGLLLCSYVLSRRVGGLGAGAVVRTGVRCLLAAVLPAVPAFLLASLVTDLVGDGPLGAALALAGSASRITSAASSRIRSRA